MVLSPLGQLVAQEWQKTAVIRPNVTLDAWVVMPNHFHGIIQLHPTPHVLAQTDNNPTPHVGASGSLAPVDAQTEEGQTKEGQTGEGRTTGSPLRAGGTLGHVMAQFKSVVSKHYKRDIAPNGSPIWQRGYYERIVRNERELLAIRKYVEDNPARWAADQENLDALFAKMTNR